ncbi:hypothetical protein McanMca71_003785 [Microsporum canis]
MSFDFDSYFKQLDPQNTWTVKRLTGGLVNLTVRASKSQNEESLYVAAGKAGRFGNSQSLILKYAPPFVASVGEAAPFDQARQNVEKNALALFSEPDGPLVPILKKTSVRVPGLVYHDEELHILVLEDLGTLPPLSDLLSISWLSSHLPAWPSLPGNYILEDHHLCLSIGKTFGQFFADLHAEGTLNLIKPHGTDPKLTRFDNSSMKEVVRRAAVSTMKPYLGQFNCADAEKLGQVVEEDFDREAVWDGEQCFNVGDLWPGGILIESSPAAAKFPKLGVIDFEFSGPGRGVNGDMAQLLAHLHLYYIAWGYCGEQFTTIQDGILALIEGLCSSYSRHSRSAGAAWQLYTAHPPGSGDRKMQLESSSPPPASSHAGRVFRSSLLLHGREIINNTVENDWSKYCTDASSGDTGDKSKGTDSKGSCLTQKMADTGIRCLQLAGNTIEEFVKVDNWKQVCSSRESSMIASLFIIDRNPLV